MITGEQMPTYRDLQLHPHINKEKQNMDVRCQSIWAYSNLHSMVLGIQMPTCRDLQLYPHIQTKKAACDHRKANANLQGLIIATSHTNQTDQIMITGKQVPTYRDL